MNNQIKLNASNRTFSAFSTLSQEAVNGYTTGSARTSPSRIFILLHGFPDNNTSFTELSKKLIAHYGESVLVVAPALRGYEPSSQGPLNTYCMFEVASDICAWIDLLNPKGKIPVHLVGHDWGAIVAFKTASMYPDRITSMVTLAIPYITNLSLFQLLWNAPAQAWCLSYMLRMQRSLYYKKAFEQSFDVLKDYTSETPPKCYLETLWRYWSPTWNFGSEIQSVAATLSQPGVLDAATAYYRNMVTWKNLKHFYWPVDFHKVPCLILGGSEDGCMVPALFHLEARLLQNIPTVDVKVLDGVGHFLHREDPDSVSKLACDWFEKYLKV